LAIGAIALVSLLSGTAITTMTSNYEMSLNTTDIEGIRADIDKYRVSVAVSLTLLVGIIQVNQALDKITGVKSRLFIHSF